MAYITIIIGVYAIREKAGRNSGPATMPYALFVSGFIGHRGTKNPSLYLSRQGSGIHEDAIGYGGEYGPAEIDECNHKPVQTVLQGHVEHVDIAVGIEHPDRDHIVHVAGGKDPDRNGKHKRYDSSDDHFYKRHMEVLVFGHIWRKIPDQDISSDHDQERDQGKPEVFGGQECRNQQKNREPDNEADKAILFRAKFTFFPCT